MSASYQRHTDVLRDTSGNAVANATVDVFVGDSMTRAALYDGAGDPVTNPVSTNSDGVIVNDTTSSDPLDAIGFRAVGGRYRMEGSANSESVGPIPDILIGNVQQYDQGTSDTEVPTNADLPNSSSVGNEPGQLPTNADRLRQITVDGDTDHTLTDAEATADLIRLTGTLTADRVLTVPDIARWYTIVNDRDGDFHTTVKTAAGAGVVVPAGVVSVVRSDGADVEGVLLNADAITKGAIVESGSTPDGDYIRWESGSQLCWITDLVLDDVSVSNGKTRMRGEWVFPVGFDTSVGKQGGSVSPSGDIPGGVDERNSGGIRFAQGLPRGESEIIDHYWDGEVTAGETETIAVTLRGFWK